MQTSIVIQLPSYLSVLVGFLLALMVLTGRLSWLVAIHLTVGAWPISILFGRVASIYVLLAAVILAGVVYAIGNARNLRLPSNDQGIIIWLAFWLIWMLILLLTGQRNDLSTNLRSLIVFEVIPLTLLLLVMSNPQEFKQFALAYIIGATVCGILWLISLDVPLAIFAKDPTLSTTGIVRLNISNYHWPSYSLAISLLLLVGFVQQTPNAVYRAVLIITAALAVYLMVMLGSRQSIVGLFVAFSFYMIWVLTRRNVPKWGIWLLVVAVVAIALFLYQTDPNLLFRPDEASLADLNPSRNRASYWSQAFSLFLDSPVWGGGYHEFSDGHNLFLSTLADQGFIGTVFLLGFLLFIFRQSRRIMVSEDREIVRWGTLLTCVIIFTLVQSQVSGDPLSEWALYWAAPFLWGLQAIGASKAETETIYQANARSRVALKNGTLSR